jgi:hypothetical protein
MSHRMSHRLADIHRRYLPGCRNNHRSIDLDDKDLPYTLLNLLR